MDILQQLGAKYPPAWHWVWGYVVLVFGAMWGSFLNVCIHRMPRGQSLIRPGSHCAKCNTPIAWYDNLPLISYFALGGKCRYCGAKFSFRYWLVEFINALLWLTVWWRFRPQDAAGWLVVAAFCIFASMLVIGTFIDFELFIIPNRITLGLVVLGLVFSVAVLAIHPWPSWVGWDAVRERAPWLLNLHPRLFALMQSFLGVVVGYALVWSIVTLGKLLFGRLKLDLPPGTVVSLTEKTVRPPAGAGKTGADAGPAEPKQAVLAFKSAEIDWSDIFAKPDETIFLWAQSVQIKGETFEKCEVHVREKEIEVQGRKFDLAKVGRIEATADALWLPYKSNAFKVLFPLGGKTVIHQGKLSFESHDIPLEELFFRPNDRVRFHAATVKVQDNSKENTAVEIAWNALWVGGEKIDLETITHVEATTERLVLPREAMGYGDIKLMAGIGAFMGPLAIFPVLLLSSAVGAFVGVAFVLLRMRELGSRMPYGPYIALGALLWLFFSRELLDWYWRFTEWYGTFWAPG